MRPKHEVISRESPPAASVEVDTATWFVTGIMERGPTDKAVLCRNMAQVEETFGERVSFGTVLYDALETFFRDGGGRAWVSRVVGPAPTVATVNLSDGAVNTLRADAVNAGEWGADVDVQIAAGSVGGTFIVIVLDDGVEVERSSDLVDKAEAIAWADNSNYIRLVDLGAGVDPQVAVNNLAGGTDDRANIVEAQWTAALVNFTNELGPGKVSAPGRTTTAAHTALRTHARDFNRYAYEDLADTAVVGTLTAEVAVHRATALARYGASFAPWAEIPGLAPGSTRIAPYSAVQAALNARLEAQGFSPNVPAAGNRGASQYAIGLSQDPWTDAELDTLHDGGVNVARVLDGAVRTYGYRSAASPVTAPAFLQINAGLTYMAIAADGDEIIKKYVFEEIDGKGKKLKELEGELRAMCLEYYIRNALYGATPEDAFDVDTGPQVNTDESIADGELKAVMAIKISPHAEHVVLEISKVSNTEVLA